MWLLLPLGLQAGHGCCRCSVGGSPGGCVRVAEPAATRCRRRGCCLPFCSTAFQPPAPAERPQATNNTSRRPPRRPPRQARQPAAPAALLGLNSSSSESSPAPLLRRCAPPLACKRTHSRRQRVGGVKGGAAGNNTCTNCCPAAPAGMRLGAGCSTPHMSRQLHAAASHTVAIMACLPWHMHCSSPTMQPKHACITQPPPPLTHPYPCPHQQHPPTTAR